MLWGEEMATEGTGSRKMADMWVGLGKFKLFPSIWQLFTQKPVLEGLERGQGNPVRYTNASQCCGEGGKKPKHQTQE